MKDLLSLPGGPAEKKQPEVPGERLELRLPPVPRQKFKVTLPGQEQKQPEVPIEPLKVRLPPVQRQPFKVILPAHGLEQPPPLQNINVRLPHFADPEVALDKIVERLGLAGKLAKVNAVNQRHLREDAIRILIQFIELDVKDLRDAGDEKSGREILQRLEELVQMLNELLSFAVPAEKRP